MDRFVIPLYVALCLVQCYVFPPNVISFDNTTSKIKPEEGYQFRVVDLETQQ